jgi:hypothetical protein
MIIEQTVDIPADRQIVIDVPKEIPSGARARVSFVVEDAAAVPPNKSAKEVFQEMFEEPEPTLKALKQRAAAGYAAWKDTGIDPLEKFRGTKIFGDGGGGLTYQRKMRAEWDA